MPVGNDRNRKTAERGYGSKWRTARAQYLADHPLCVRCQQLGLVAAATVVDHVVPHRGDLRLFWDRGNWQPLCKACHDRHKQREERGGLAAGCDEDGMPVDRRHRWHGSGTG